MNRNDRTELYLWCAIIGVGIFIVLCLSGCQLTQHDAEAIGARSAHLAAIAELPLANLAFTEDGTFGGAYGGEEQVAEAECATWSITFNLDYAAGHVDFILNKALPHEYSHLASCYHRGGMGDPALGPDADVHDAYWRQWVIKLGGDPDYV